MIIITLVLTALVILATVAAYRKGYQQGCYERKESGLSLTVGQSRRCKEHGCTCTKHSR